MKISPAFEDERATPDRYQRHSQRDSKLLPPGFHKTCWRLGNTPAEINVRNTYLKTRKWKKLTDGSALLYILQM